MLSKEEIKQAKSRLNFRKGESKEDTLVRSFQTLSLLEKSYGEIYRGLKEVSRDLAARPDDTSAREKEVQDLTRQVVLFFRGAKRMHETTINELVPGTFPPPKDEPTASIDIDCDTASGIAFATCMLAAETGLWQVGVACGAAIAVAAAVC